jgi:hypothetical protein
MAFPPNGFFVERVLLFLTQWIAGDECWLNEGRQAGGTEGALVLCQGKDEVWGGFGDGGFEFRNGRVAVFI